MSDPLESMLEHVYGSLDGSETAQGYTRRHEIASAAILTVTEDETAETIARYLEPRIAGRTVVEVGAGIGLLALHLAEHATHVYAIEASPAWTWCFVGVLYQAKPKNVSWLFGAADEFAPWLRADVALFCTHSGHEEMRTAASAFAPVVIDVYQDVIPLDEARKRER